MGDFSADKWPKIAGRIEFCRIAAREAERDAKSASPDLRDLYWALAAQWRLLAIENERYGLSESSRRVSP
jgi:hypothetical protein